MRTTLSSSRRKTQNVFGITPATTQDHLAPSTCSNTKVRSSRKTKTKHKYSTTSFPQCWLMKLQSTPPTTTMKGMDLNSFWDIYVTTEAVRKKLLKLKNNKAAGLDNMNVNVMRQCPDLDQPLHIIFNQSIQTGRTPQDWRYANITPLFKKGSRVVPNNYRPVSLTSQAVKTLERIIYDELIALATKNKTISCDQHGFQDKCSCITQLLECLNDWTRNYDERIQTDIIYLDFAKAFHTVPHQRLIIKLRKYGVRGKVLQ